MLHLGQRFRAALPIAMLPGKRAARPQHEVGGVIQEGAVFVDSASACQVEIDAHMHAAAAEMAVEGASVAVAVQECAKLAQIGADPIGRSEEHTSELQSLMRISYAVFCLKKKQQKKIHRRQQH